MCLNSVFHLSSERVSLEDSRRGLLAPIVSVLIAELNFILGSWGHFQEVVLD